MSIVKVSNRRIYIPKEIPFSAKKALLIPLDNVIIIVPIPDKPVEIDISEDIRELRELAEKKARDDAIKRAKRRNQI